MKISGTFCERTEAPKSSFDRRSFRWKRTGKSWILIGCPRGHWNMRSQRCKVGTRAHKVLSRAKGRCRIGKRISK